MDYNTLATADSVAKTTAALTAHSFAPVQVASAAEAFAKIKELIPAGASVMNGASVTLTQIGFVEYLKTGEHGWNNLHDAVLAEKDPEKQALLRKHSVISDFYLGSAHALTETGEIIFASNTGSQLPHLAFTSPNVILVIGANKIVPTIQEGLNRIQTQVVPLEDERMKKAYGFGTLWSKTLILNKENPALGRKVHVIIVNEALGF